MSFMQRVRPLLQQFLANDISDLTRQNEASHRRQYGDFCQQRLLGKQPVGGAAGR